MLIGRVWICRLLFVRLFVNFSLCTVTDFSAGDKASGVKFCTMVYGRHGHGISHFGEFCSSRSPKADESAPVLKMFFLKKGTVSKGRVSGHPGHPLDPPLIMPYNKEILSYICTLGTKMKNLIYSPTHLGL